MRKLLLAILCCLTLASPSYGVQAVFTPANLHLVGGFRMARFIPGVGTKWLGETAFSNGGAAIDYNPGGTTTVWMHNHTQKRQLCVATTTSNFGTGAYTTWPLLTESDCFTPTELFGATTASDGFQNPEGVLWDEATSKLWVSCRSNYATLPDVATWICSIQYPGKTITQGPTCTSSQQAYGGGFALAPQSFADAYAHGNRLMFCAGGYKSGQRSLVGPTLAAMPYTAGGSTTATIFMRWLQINQIQTTPIATARTQICQSFPDYSSSLSWTLPAEGDVGYWQSVWLTGNGAWVDSPEFKGVVWCGPRGVSPPAYSYAAQNEGWGTPLKGTMWVFNPDIFTTVASGGQNALGIPKSGNYEFYNWTSAENGGIPGRVRSCIWDETNQLLWICYVKTWTSGSYQYPVMAAYELVPDEAPPASVEQVFSVGDPDPLVLKVLSAE